MKMLAVERFLCAMDSSYGHSSALDGRAQHFRPARRLRSGLLLGCYEQVEVLGGRYRFEFGLQVLVYLELALTLGIGSTPFLQPDDVSSHGGRQTVWPGKVLNGHFQFRVSVFVLPDLYIPACAWNDGGGCHRKFFRIRSGTESGTKHGREVQSAQFSD